MIATRHLYLNIFMLFTFVQAAHAQIDAVEPDSILDKYYINLPVDVGRKSYLPDDTVIAVYNTPPNAWSNIYDLVFRHYPKTQFRPVYVIRAIVDDVSTLDNTDSYMVKGLKLKIFSIERHYKDGVEHLDEYITPYRSCRLKMGQEKWVDIYDWQNITGLYKIRKATDNYKIGDTVHRIYHADRSLLGEMFSPGRYKTYELKAIVMAMDTTAAQTLLLHFTTIKLKYYRGSFINPNKSKDVIEYAEKMEYNYHDVEIGDMVWTKPYLWFGKGQNAVATDSRAIPSSISLYVGCGFRVLNYDCDGNQFSLDYSQRN